MAYNIFQTDLDRFNFKSVRVPAKGRISGRTMMIHGFMPEYSNQGRGYSRLEHILQDTQDITDYKLSVIKKMISQSQNVYVCKAF